MPQLRPNAAKKKKKKERKKSIRKIPVYQSHIETLTPQRDQGRAQGEEDAGGVTDSPDLIAPGTTLYSFQSVCPWALRTPVEDRKGEGTKCLAELTALWVAEPRPKRRHPSAPFLHIRLSGALCWLRKNRGLGGNRWNIPVGAEQEQLSLGS